MVKYGNENANSYLMGTMQHTLAAQAAEDEQKNVSAGKTALKSIALTVVFIGGFLGFLAQSGVIH